MLKGHVFSKQIFGNPMFALFINTFLNGRNGVSNNYKNGMQVTYSGSNLTIDSGAVCIQGRFLEEDTGSTVPAGTDTAYCKLVIEINLDLQNTESQFNQGVYKVVKSASNYPNLTQTNIVKNNAGIYQYELARFRTNTSGITEFQDMRTFLDFDSIYDEMEAEYQAVLQQLQEELESIENQSDVLLKSVGGTVTGDTTFSGKLISDNIQKSNGTKVVYKDDIAVLTGNFALNSGTDYSTDISYPNGFNKNNCAVMAFGLVMQNDSNGRGYNFGGTYKDSSDLLNNALNRDVNLRDSQIHIRVKSLGTSGNYTYKIVLMKIA